MFHNTGRLNPRLTAEMAANLVVYTDNATVSDMQMDKWKSGTIIG
jgi:hypothetical protein